MATRMRVVGGLVMQVHRLATVATGDGGYGRRWLRATVATGDGGYGRRWLRAKAALGLGFLLPISPTWFGADAGASSASWLAGAAGRSLEMIGHGFQLAAGGTPTGEMVGSASGPAADSGGLPNLTELLESLASQPANLIARLDSVLEELRGRFQLSGWTLDQPLTMLVDADGSVQLLGDDGEPDAARQPWLFENADLIAELQELVGKLRAQEQLPELGSVVAPQRQQLVAQFDTRENRWSWRGVTAT